MQAAAELAGADPGTVLGVETDAAQLDLLRDPDTGKLPANVFQLSRQRAAGRGRGRPAGARNKKSDQLGRIIVEKYGDPVEGMAALYAMPLDQLVELLMVADGSKDREEKLMLLADRTVALVDRMYDDSENGRALTDKQIEKLDQLVDRVGDLAKVLKSKPGELSWKAINTQLAARREVAQYVHSKRPVAVDITRRADVILNIPGLTDAAHLAEYVEGGELSEEDMNRLEYAPFIEVPDGAIEDSGDEA